jgi:hypothetical protein
MEQGELFKFPPKKSRKNKQPQEWKLVSLRECPLPEQMQVCDTPERAEAYWRAHVATDPRFNPECECFVILFLNTRKRIKGHQLLSVGTMDNRLILFPHPHRAHPELGIRHTHITNATTTTGKVTNALEAEAVAKRVRELVMREYAKPPRERLTIGVVTMNLYQQDCIMDLLENMRQDDRRFDLAMITCASEQNEEPLFVRNLENIQGDERDIMILSCTYGPHSPGGTPTQRFGPLNREGGERRFNVLITRAMAHGSLLFDPQRPNPC